MKWVTKTAVWLSLALLSLFVLLPIAGASNNEKNSFTVANNTGCGIDEGIIITFQNDFIRSDDRTNKPDRGGHYLKVNTYIPAGNYDITLRSYDIHDANNQHPEQTHEQWHLIFRAGEDVVATSNSISDLPDLDFTRTEKVNTALSIPRDVDNILAYHSYYLHDQFGKDINSVYPQCAGLAQSNPPRASIGDLVWLDDNKNGLQDSFEKGVPFVDVHLYNEYGHYLQSTTTDENGRYGFSQLEPGMYAVQVDPPAGYTVTGMDLGDDNFNDSDIDRNGRMVFTELVADEHDPSWDAGIYLNDEIVIDRPQNNIARIVCLNSQESLPPTDVVLYYGDIPLETRSPDFNGNIEFTTVSRQGEDMGYFNDWNFTSSFDPMQFSIQVILPTRTIHLDAAQSSSGNSDSHEWDIELLFEECNSIVDAAIGDFVWLDYNKNDVQDNGEPGVADVTVILFDINNNEVERTVTDDGGRYFFDELTPGDYSLQFIPPPGYSVVQPRKGISTAFDSDINLADFRTPMTRLEAFEVDLTWDAGLFTPNKLPACARFNLDLGRSAQNGAGIEGTYVMIEMSTGSTLASWEAESWWADSGWIRDIDLSHPEGSWVDVYFYPEGSDTAVKLEIINPAPGTPYGWLAPGICHAIELQFPADWNPGSAS